MYWCWRRCGRWLLKWLPVIPHLLVFTCCVILTPFMWAGPSDFFLTNVIRQKWWDVTSMIMLQKTVTSILLALFLSGSLCLLALMKQVAMLLTDLEEVYLARKWGQLLVNSQWGTEAFCWAAFEILNPARGLNLEADLSLVEPWGNCSLNQCLDCSLWRDFEPKDPCKLCPGFWPTETVR